MMHRPTWSCAKPTELKTFMHQDFHGIHLGTFVGLSNPHISKITNFYFLQNSLPSHLAMPWCTANLGNVQNPPNSKLSCTKTFNGIHLGTFLGLSNPHISKITNFIFSQNSLPSHLAMSWCTDQLGHMQNRPNSKLSCSKTFMVFFWGHLEAFPTLTSKKSRISFFHKTPHQAILLCRGAPPSLAMCKTHRTQNFRAPRPSWYSFGDIWRLFQPSHLKNHEFHFFTKLPTKPSSYVVVHRQPWPCAKPTELKTFVHQAFMLFIWGHLEAFPTLTAQKSRISFFHKTPHQAILLCRHAPNNLAKCKTH